MKYLFPILLVSMAALAATPPILPDHNLTPGVVDVDATLDKICVVGYTTTVRNVPQSVKRNVFKEYGIDPKSDKYEVDHLVSLELGGANDIKNLWPQSYTTLPYNARLKDRLENKLHKLVCSKQLDLAVAQKEISTDWVAAYGKYVK